MSYKIEFFHNGKKHKHKLYDSLKMFERMWDYHVRDTEWHSAYLSHSIKGYIDGVLVKEHPLSIPKINVACPDDLNWDDLQDAQDPNES